MIFSKSNLVIIIKFQLFNGTDGKGSHATLYIDDQPTRIESGFESIEDKYVQNILTEEKVSKMFDLKTMTTFEKHVKDDVVTRAEKYAFISMINRSSIW
jgi:hypothetical protein